MMKADPFLSVKKLILERYKDAKAVFWAGSVSRGQGTAGSDLDLIVVFESIPNAYREAYLYDGWPIDVFVHDMESLRYFFEESRVGKGIAGMASMLLHAREVTEPTDFSEKIKTVAQQVLKAGPEPWDKDRIDKERFFISDVLDDIKNSVSKDEKTASGAWLYEALAQFYFRAKNEWCASGKAIVRYLKQDNPELAKDFIQSFDKLFQTGNSTELDKLTQKILAPYGGLLWDGFRSEAPKESKLKDIK
jgi:hypothetical protein